jgi:hypothetical protein
VNANDWLTEEPGKNPLLHHTCQSDEQAELDVHDINVKPWDSLIGSENELIMICFDKFNTSHSNGYSKWLHSNVIFIPW